MIEMIKREKLINTLTMTATMYQMDDTYNDCNYVSDG